MDAGGTSGRRLPAGLRALRDLRPEHADPLGEEARDLARLVDAGEPVGPGWLVRLADEASVRLEAAVELALLEAECARLRPLLRTVAARQRFEREVGWLPDIEELGEAPVRIEELLEVLRRPEVTVALGGSAADLHVRVIACARVPWGRATSADPDTGDPDELSVWSARAPAARWRIDRRSMRVTSPGEGLEAGQAAEVGDVADRAQLVLGKPVEVEWCTQDGGVAVVGVRTLELSPTFGRGSWRRVALMAADEGTVAPLAIDALDKALGRNDPPGELPRVKRVYARPYRRRDVEVRRPGSSSDASSLARTAARAARVARDVAAPLAAARGFSRRLGPRLESLDAVGLRNLDDEELVLALRERHQLVTEAFVLVDHAREATLTSLKALEAAAGPLPRDSFAALAAPRPSRWRRRTHERLQKLARRIELEHRGAVVGRGRLSPSLRRRWDDLRGELADVRPLGIDVRPDAHGGHDAHLLEALRRVGSVDYEMVEQARRDAVRRALATAQARPLGRAREAIVVPLTVVLGRVASSKGSLAEGLAAVLLRLRRVAHEAGRRLAEAGVLDGPQDALYLHLAEIEEALAGEPGAYAARVRLRREDDARWARFEAPRRVEGRF